MTGIRQLQCCYGNSVAIATRENLNNSFFFSCIESIFGMEILWHDRHQPATSFYGNSVAMAARPKP